MPVFMMKQVLSIREFYGWIEYVRTKPPSIQEHQMAVLTMVAANAMGGKSKVTDFIISQTPKDAKKVKEATAFDSFAAIATDFKPSTTS